MNEEEDPDTWTPELRLKDIPRYTPWAKTISLSSSSSFTELMRIKRRIHPEKLMSSPKIVKVAEETTLQDAFEEVKDFLPRNASVAMIDGDILVRMDTMPDEATREAASQLASPFKVLFSARIPSPPPLLSPQPARAGFVRE